MKWGRADQSAVLRNPIARAALQLAIAEAVRKADPQELIGIVVERIVPTTARGANWTLKGGKYGEADRARCLAAIAGCVKERQGEFELSDGSE
jgi:hypothetical protein